MNVSSSTSATTSTNATSAAASTSKAQNNSSTSFEEEMKNVETSAENTEQETQQKTETKSENKDASGKEQQQDKLADNVLTGKVEIDNDIDVDAHLNTTDLLTLNIQQLIDTQNQINNRVASISTSEDLTQNIGETLNIQTMEMTVEDVQFFVDVVKNNNAGVQNVVQDVQQAMTFGTEKVQKSANVSKTLIVALQNTVKTGQAVRIDFGNDVAVVMRVGRDGAIMANFIPGDKAVEEYLKNNIGFLKQRFDEEDIPYSNLSYSQHQQQEKRQQQENNKENRHE